VRVSDGTLATTQTFTLNVGTQAPNQSPTITSSPSQLTNLDRVYAYNLTGSDPDGDLLLWSLDSAPAQAGPVDIDVQVTDPEGTPVTYQLLTGPSGMSIDAQTGLLTGNKPSPCKAPPTPSPPSSTSYAATTSPTLVKLSASSSKPATTLASPTCNCSSTVSLSPSAATELPTPPPQE
jgi:large repetitive protein